MDITSKLAAIVHRVAPWIFLALLWNHAVRYAWMAEDAYINFRVIDNVLAGLGPTWNPGERVQVYTSALWMALSIPLTALLHNPVEATWLLSAALIAWTVAMLWLASGRRTLLWLVVAAAWCTSRSVRDYLCSGLETPLVMAAVATAVGLPQAWPRLSARRLAGLLGMCLLVRHDLVLLLGPLMLQAMWARVTAAEPPGNAKPALTTACGHLANAALIGGLPLIAWSAWAWLYYGSPLPNTALAKIVDNWQGAPQAIDYFHFMQHFDPWAYGIMAVAVAITWACRSRLLWPLLAGLGLFMAYLLHIGADYMGGRFFVGPVTLCVTVTASALHSLQPDGTLAGLRPIQVARAQLAAMFAVLTSFGAATWMPEHPSTYVVPLPIFVHGIADERQYHWGFTDLQTLRLQGVPAFLRHNGEAIAQVLKDTPNAGPFLVCNIGMTGYFAPRGVTILDPLALSDRFLAGLPAASATARVGHFERPVPQAYLLSRMTGRNAFEDLILAAYYNDVQWVVSGPLLDRQRLAAIWRLSTGAYRSRLRHWQAGDGGGPLSLPQLHTRERLGSCLGGESKVMQARQVAGRVDIQALPAP
jgi:arabinofuranosyltransferase